VPGAGGVVESEGYDDDAESTVRCQTDRQLLFLYCSVHPNGKTRLDKSKCGLGRDSYLFKWRNSKEDG